MSNSPIKSNSLYNEFISKNFNEKENKENLAICSENSNQSYDLMKSSNKKLDENS